MTDIQILTGGIAATNAFLWKGPQGAFLVDAPQGAADWLASQGVRLEALLLTHAHFDHVLDAAAIQKKHDCRLYAFAEPNADLTLENMLSSFGSAFEVAPYHVDHSVHDGERLEIPEIGLSFEVAHVPGHSLDSVTFYWPEERILFAGDVLMAGGIGRCDFPGGDQDLLVRGIREKLYSLPEETCVYSGHGPATTIGEEKRSNPWVRGAA